MINWNKVCLENVDPETFNSIIEENNITTTIVAENIVSTEHRLIGKVQYVKTPNADLFYLLNEGEPKRYQVRNTANEDSGITGTDAFLQIAYDFKKIHKVSFKEAFGHSRFVKQQFNDPQSCVPSPINYGYSEGRELINSVYKIDICSAYAYEASKPLPTTTDHLKVDGFAEPTSEYPFAFYKSNANATCKLSIYGEFETDLQPNEVEKTYLCKQSKYSLAPILKKYFDAKNSATSKMEKLQQKAYMNYFVGYCQRNRAPVYSHISAVVIARCNHRVISICDKIEDSLDGKVILINTDAIAWTGADIPSLYTNEKKIGNFILEHKNCKAYIKGPKSYQLLDEDGTLTTIYAGIRKEVSQKFKFGEIFEAHVQSKIWIWDCNTTKYKSYEVDYYD